MLDEDIIKFESSRLVLGDMLFRLGLIGPDDVNVQRTLNPLRGLFPLSLFLVVPVLVVLILLYFYGFLGGKLFPFDCHIAQFDIGVLGIAVPEKVHVIILFFLVGLIFTLLLLDHGVPQLAHSAEGVTRSQLGTAMLND